MDEKAKPRLRKPLGIGMLGMLVVFLGFNDTDSRVLSIDLLIVSQDCGNIQGHAAKKGNQKNRITHA